MSRRCRCASGNLLRRRRRQLRPARSALILAAIGVCAPAARAQDAELLSRDRITALPVAERAAWLTYLDTSAHYAALDRAALDAELEGSGRTRPVPAPQARDFRLDDSHTAEWFRSAAGRRTADAILSFQTPSGGWSKRIDFRRPRRPGMSYASSVGWSYIGTFDNDATSVQLRFLARAFHALQDERYRSAYRRGVEYMLRAQFPNGCWPQVYPLQGGYHDAVTYNDDALVQVLEVLREVATESVDLVPADLRVQAGAAVSRGIDCILATQVVMGGAKTVWGAQHDPLSFQPVQARTYEHASLSGAESAGVMRFLMEIAAPSDGVVEAVHAAAAWFSTHAIHNVDYQAGRGLAPMPGAGPVWARFYELGTNRPIFSNRDGIVRYDFHELDDERRLGYAWYSDRPAEALRVYERWTDRMRSRIKR